MAVIETHGDVMIETCMTLWHFANHERWYDEGLAASMRAMAKAGFTHVNWNVDAGSSYVYASAEIDYFAAMLSDAGLRGWSVHGSNGRNNLTEIAARGAEGHFIEGRKDYLSPHEWQRQAGLHLIRNRIELAAAIGARSVVMHVEFPDAVYRDRDTGEAAFQILHRSLDDLKDDCAKHGVRLAIENIPSLSIDDMSTLLDRVFARHDGSFVGLCFDSGHAQIVEPGGLTLLHTFGERLVATHLHDNDGRNDQHLLPGDGCIPFERVLAAIADTPYTLPLTFETPYRLYGTGYFLPEEVFYRRAYSVICEAEHTVRARRHRVRPADHRILVL